MLTSHADFKSRYAQVWQRRDAISAADIRVSIVSGHPRYRLLEPAMSGLLHCYQDHLCEDPDARGVDSVWRCMMRDLVSVVASEFGGPDGRTAALGALRQALDEVAVEEVEDV